MTQIDPPSAADPAAAAEVYFDGACPLCRAEIAQYRRMNGAQAIAWRDVAAGEVPADLDAARALARFHVRRGDGRLVSGFRAFLAVWRTNPRLAPLARLLGRAPMVSIGEGAYRGFLILRPLWRPSRPRG